MSQTPSKDPVIDFYRQTSQNRYQFTLDEITKQKTLWTLSDDQGCVIVDSGKEQCLPLWPNEETAKAWATAEHKECQPLCIPLTDFLEKWVPGMTRDGYHLAIAPSMAAESIVETPQQFAEALK